MRSDVQHDARRGIDAAYGAIADRSRWQHVAIDLARYLNSSIVLICAFDLQKHSVDVLGQYGFEAFDVDAYQSYLGLIAHVGRVRVLTASGEDLTETDDPARVMIRQVAAAFAQFEKARLVQKLRNARERKKAALGRCEGRKPVPVETVEEARKLARKSRKTGLRPSLRAISAALAERGHTVMIELGGKRVPSGKPYGAESIKRMLAA